MVIDWLLIYLFAFQIHWSQTFEMFRLGSYYLYTAELISLIIMERHIVFGRVMFVLGMTMACFLDYINLLILELQVACSYCASNDLSVTRAC